MKNLKTIRKISLHLVGISLVLSFLISFAAVSNIPESSPSSQTVGGSLSTIFSKIFPNPANPDDGTVKKASVASKLTSFSCPANQILVGLTSTGYICDWNNCLATSKTVNTHIYSVPRFNHTTNTTSYSTVNITNGTIQYSQAFSCSNGSVSVSGAEQIANIDCNDGYVVSGNMCVNPAINGVCGSANGTIVSTAPTTNLCSAGTATAVNGSGPWNWTCNGSNEGINASCIAYIPTTCSLFVDDDPLKGTGLSCYYNGTYTSDGAYYDATHYCLNGDMLTLDINGYLLDGTCIPPTPTPINGSCGSANGTSTSSYPTTNLCSVGSVTNIDTTGSDGIFNWKCNGINGGSTASCSANKIANATINIINNQNGSLIVGAGSYYSSDTPFSYNVTSGTTIPVSWDNSGAGGEIIITGTNGFFYEWQNEDIMGVGSTSFSALAGVTYTINYNYYSSPIAINGVCGSANGTIVSTAPTTNLCSAGTATAVNGSGPWNWTCDGINLGSNASCSASNTVIITPPPTCPTGADECLSGGYYVIYSSNMTYTNGCNSGSLPSPDDYCIAAFPNTNGDGSYIYTSPYNYTNKTVPDIGGLIGWYIPPTYDAIIANIIKIKYTQGFYLTSQIGAAGENVYRNLPSGVYVADCFDFDLECLASRGIITSYTRYIHKGYPLNPAINGVCGSANGTIVSTAPTTNLCSAGTATAVNGSGPWNWTCDGINLGSNASCSAQLAIQRVPITIKGSAILTPEILAYGLPNNFTKSFPYTESIIMSFYPWVTQNYTYVGNLTGYYITGEADWLGNPGKSGYVVKCEISTLNKTIYPYWSNVSSAQIPASSWCGNPSEIFGCSAYTYYSCGYYNVTGGWPSYNVTTTYQCGWEKNNSGLASSGFKYHVYAACDTDS